MILKEIVENTVFKFLEFKFSGVVASCTSIFIYKTPFSIRDGIISLESKIQNEAGLHFFSHETLVIPLVRITSCQFV